MQLRWEAKQHSIICRIVTGQVLDTSWTASTRSTDTQHITDIQDQSQASAFPCHIRGREKLMAANTSPPPDSHYTKNTYTTVRLPQHHLPPTNQLLSSYLHPSLHGRVYSEGYRPGGASVQQPTRAKITRRRLDANVLTHTHAASCQLTQKLTHTRRTLVLTDFLATRSVKTDTQDRNCTISCFTD